MPPLDEVTKRRFDRLNDAGYLAAFSGMAQAMCAPFWWSSQAPGEAPVINGNGTICYVNTGTRHIGITADHVYAEYLAHKAALPDVTCQLGSSTFDPGRHLIDRSPENALDLATFDVPEVFVTSSFGNYHHNALRWTPDVAAQGEAVLYGGFPQVLRNPKTNSVEFPFQYFIGAVNSTDTTRIILDPDPPHIYWPGHAGETINDRWGGQSGGPVYRVIDAMPGGEPADRLELVGIIYQRWSGTILARHVQFISPDGTIQHQ